VTHIIDDLRWRGLIALSTDLGALRTELARGPVTYYGGFDPTAPSLHVGNLVLILTLRRLQLAGHRPLALVGGATGLIGDPSGRSTERVLQSPEQVADWVERIRGQIEPYLDFTGEFAARVVNNLDWTEGLGAIEFLRDLGRHFRVNKMIAKDAVSARLRSEEGISYTEFSYQILQAMDYLELFRRCGCRLQAGGSDQWGNLTAGADLIRRVTGEPVHLIATPLVTDTQGRKLGKSSGAGGLWLAPELTSPYAFYQYFVNVEDAQLAGLLRIFTFLDPEEIEELEKETAQRPAARAGQRRLAEDLTRRVHGEAEARQAVAASQALFGRGSLDELAPETLRAALAEAGLVQVPAGPDGQLPSVAELFTAAGLVAGRNQARRTVAEGGAYLNNQRVADADAPVPAEALRHGRFLVLRRGRRSVAGVERVP
jgi:tyrosyl-tRNA synthetase